LHSNTEGFQSTGFDIPLYASLIESVILSNLSVCRSSKFIVVGRGTARSSNQAPNNATQTKQKAHKE